MKRFASLLVALIALAGCSGGEPSPEPAEPTARTSPVATFAIVTLTAPPAAPTNTPEPTPTPEPTAPPASPLDTLRVAIEQRLGVSTRDVPRVARVDISTGTLFVDWNINDYIAEDGLRRNGGTDIVNLLRTIAEHGKGLEYNDVALSGFFSLTDASGNVRDAMVVQVWYDRNLVETTDWPGAYDRIYTLAKTTRIHDVFEE